MAQLFEYIKMALMNIRSNKGRSILTMLGIIIGISSVIMVISIGNGLSSQVSDELNNLAGGYTSIPEALWVIRRQATRKQWNLPQKILI